MSRFGKSNERTEHRYVKERLSAYLDGELLPQERDAVERHLATCQSCQWEFHTLRQTMQWTKELPTLLVPRVFMIPVPARPVRASRQRWSFVPLLQGATALVALLLVLVVAGDVMLTGALPAAVPELVVMREQAPANVSLTIAVEDAEKAPADMAAEVMAEEAITELTYAPALVEAPPTQPLPAGAAPADTATPQTFGTGGAGYESPQEEGMGDAGEVGAIESPPAPALEATAMEAYTVSPTPTLLLRSALQATVTQTGTSVVGVEPTATVHRIWAPTPTVMETGAAASKAGEMPATAPTRAPEPTVVETEVAAIEVEPTQALGPTTSLPESPTIAAPTTVAEVREPARVAPADQGQRPARAMRVSPGAWLRVAESVLGTTLVLFGVATVVFMLLRRRDR